MDGRTKAITNRQHTMFSKDSNIQLIGETKSIEFGIFNCKMYLPNSTLGAIASGTQLYIPRWHFKFDITKLIDIHNV